MLVRLFAENFGVFRDGFDLSLEATRLPSERDRGYFEVPVASEKEPLRLLRLAGIYGPNASGKSTVVQAARALHAMVVRSAPDFQEGEPIPHYEPFRLDQSTRDKPCSLGCEVVVDADGTKRVVEYAISFTGREVTHERIVERGRTSDTVWLERTANQSIEVPKDSRLKALPLDLNHVTRPNAAAISIGAQLGQKPLMDVFHALSNALHTLVADHGSMGSMEYSLRQLDQNEDFRGWALQRLLVPADIGITDVRTEEREVPEEVIDRLALFVDDDKLESMRNRIEAVFSHRGVGGRYELDFSDESAGTRKLLALAGPWHDVIRRQRTLFVDELSSSLHPELLTALLDAFNTAPAQSHAQLVFTVHDPSPLEETLRRDQVYFTEKNGEGVARLYPLSDFRDRSNNNIRKRYLEGRYGALPRDPDFGSLFEPMGADD